MLFLSVGWRPFALNSKVESERDAKRAAAWARMHAEMLEAGGVILGQGMDHSEQGTSIAINLQERLVLLLAGGVYKSYDYEDLLEWSGGEGDTGNLSVDRRPKVWTGTPANPRNSRRENDSFILFASVRDREFPVWRISMRDQTVRARWLEILRQEISGGAWRRGELSTGRAQDKHFNDKGN